MKQFTVLYDPTCGFCVTCRQWLARQHKLIPMRFLPQGSGRARAAYPDLTYRTDDQGRPDELVVIDERGNVYRDDKAWVMCFYAMRDYRGLSMTLAKPGMAGLARRAYTLVSGKRRLISTLLGKEEEVVQTLRDTPDEPGCHNALCALREAKKTAAIETGAEETR